MRFHRRSGIAALATALVLAAGAAPADAATIVALPSNTLPTSLATQTGRIILSAVTRTCAAPAPAAPTPFGSDPYHYREHSFKSSLAHPVCVTVDLTSSCAYPNDITSASYVDDFLPLTPGANYLADMGFAASSTQRPYSFVVGPERQWSTVVSALSPSTGCSGYALTLSSRGPWAQTRPAIGGVATLGAQLTGTDATWTGAMSTARQWRRCDTAGANCVDIPGATGTTYTVGDADLGRTVRLRSQATDAEATNSSDSAPVEPFIALETRSGQSVGPGDQPQVGSFVRNGIESRCGAPTTAPAIIAPANVFFSESLPAITSLLNEPVCLVVRTTPMCPGGVTPSIYSPAFTPGALTTNYAANSGTSAMAPGAVSWSLGSGVTAEVVLTQGQSGVTCSPYAVSAGTAGPFATARPAIAGTAAEGITLSADDGTWTGSPAVSRSWRRCDAAGAACEPIDGATASTYTPTAADAGKRLRVRVTATRGTTLSSDSEPTAPVTASAPPPPAGSTVVVPSATTPPSDTTAPTVRLRVLRASLQTVLRRGHLRVAVTCSELCTLGLRAEVARSLRRRLGGTRIASGSAAGPAGRPVTVRVTLTRKARRALRRSRAVRFVLVVTAADAAGNRGSVSRTVRLKRPRRR